MFIKSRNNSDHNSSNGFTLIELILTVLIIGILASISVISYGNWQKRLIESQLKSDLSGAATAMEDYKNFNDSYPSSVPSTFSSSEGVNLSGGGNKRGDGYCIDAFSSKDESIDYYIDQYNRDVGAQFGTCSSRTEKWANVAVGYYHTCAVTDDGLPYCWGINGNGQLGNNSTSNRNKPVAVVMSGALNGKIIKSISVGDYNTCAISDDGLAYCWGLNDKGQLGNNSTEQSNVPVAVVGALIGKTVQSISTGDNYSCAITTDGQGYCWGLNDKGQLGNNSISNSSVPISITMSGVLNGLAFRSISAGAFSTCSVATNNMAYCWGYNVSGQLGNGLITQSLVPVAVLGALSGHSVRSISTGEYHACALTIESNAYCWGWNPYGQLGDGSNNNSAIPIAVIVNGSLNNTTIMSLSSGKYGACAISSAYKAHCWGWGITGQLGNDSAINSSVPVSVLTSGILDNKVINAVSVGDYHACALSSDYRIYCWGSGNYGQLGNGSNTQKLVPVGVLSS